MSTLEPLERLVLSEKDATQLGLTPGTLTLHRMWPRQEGHMALEYIDAYGRVVPGQWLAKQRKFHRIFDETHQSCRQFTRAAVLPLNEQGILLQVGGADRKLLGLASILEQPGAQLVVHRPERRAVVRVDGDETYFVKVIRPERVKDLAAMMQWIHDFAGGCFQTPVVLSTQVPQGIINLSALPGKSLYEWLSSQDIPFAAGRAGAALRTLHLLTPLSTAKRHTANEEIEVLSHWLARIRMVAPAQARYMQGYADLIMSALLSDSSSTVLLHRDYYDKQVFITEDGQTGILDFDTLSIGEAALDIANMLVHFELRFLQGRILAEQLDTAIATFLDRYDPSKADALRINTYADATRLRLSCVYSFRPYGREYVPKLLGQIGRPILSNLI